jgi:hypothetical protein
MVTIEFVDLGPDVLPQPLTALGAGPRRKVLAGCTGNQVGNDGRPQDLREE